MNSTYNYINLTEKRKQNGGSSRDNYGYKGMTRTQLFFHKKTTARKIRNNVSSILDAEGDRQCT